MRMTEVNKDRIFIRPFEKKMYLTNVIKCCTHFSIWGQAAGGAVG